VERGEVALFTFEVMQDAAHVAQRSVEVGDHGVTHGELA
jgi:hypothetical protein